MDYSHLYLVQRMPQVAELHSLLLPAASEACRLGHVMVLVVFLLVVVVIILCGLVQMLVGGGTIIHSVKLDC